MHPQKTPMFPSCGEKKNGGNHTTRQTSDRSMEGHFFPTSGVPKDDNYVWAPEDWNSLLTCAAITEGVGVDPSPHTHPKTNI